MSHLVGETVVLRTTTGGGYDRYGDPLPETHIDEPVHHAVVIHEGSDRFDDDAVLGGEVRNVSVMLPGFYEVEQDATVVIRGEEWRVEKPPFDHRSVFGSSLGGTELFVRRATA